MSASGKQPVVLVAGTFCYPEAWDAMKAELEQRGFDVYAPPLRYHDLPLLEGSRKMAEVSLTDYSDDFVELIMTLDKPPIIIGWSMGGLIAQLVAQRVEHAGLVLLSPAPAAGMFALYPSMLKVFQHHFARWGFWRKPLIPEWETFVWGTGHLTPKPLVIEMFDQLKAESGRAYFEMSMWFLDKTKASKVYPERIKGPVLVIAGESDRIVRTPISRRTAARYPKSEFIGLVNMDHILVAGEGLQRVMGKLDPWLAAHGFNAES